MKKTDTTQRGFIFSEPIAYSLPPRSGLVLPPELRNNFDFLNLFLSVSTPQNREMELTLSFPLVHTNNDP